MRNISTAILLLAALLLGQTSRAQVGIGTPTPDASAALEIQAAGKGLLLPRVRLAGLADATTVPAPAAALLVFNTNAALPGGAGFYYNAGMPPAPAWTRLNTGTPAGDNLGNHTATQNLNLTDKLLVGGTAGVPGTDGLKIAGTGQVGIALGAAAPGYPLDVNGTINGRYYCLAGKLGLHFGNTQADKNAFVGTGATSGINPTGTNNTAVGDAAAGNLNGGTHNTFVGADPGYQVHNGNHNTALGYYAGYSLNLSNAASTASNGWALKAQATDGVGVRAIATTGQALWATANGSGPAATITQSGSGLALDVTSGGVRTKEVPTPSTGTHNMLPVAYGEYIDNLAAAILNSSGNFTVVKNSPGDYTLTFPQFSGVSLSGAFIQGVAAQNFFSPGDIYYATSTGLTNGRVSIQVRNINRNFQSAGFSFIMFNP